MKAYICDRCGRQEPPADQDLVPIGWTTIYSHPNQYVYATKHVCSTTCLQTLADAQRIAEQPAVEPPVEEPARA